MQKLNKCTYQVFALIYYGDVVNPFCFLCKLPNLHIWFWTNILIQYVKHHCALKNAKKWFCEILELLAFCAKVTKYVINLYIIHVIALFTLDGQYHFSIIGIHSWSTRIKLNPNFSRGKVCAHQSGSWKSNLILDEEQSDQGIFVNLSLAS